MGSKSDYLEAKLLDHVLGNTAYTPPATMYVALFTSTPGDGNSGTEVTGGSYARVAVANNTTNWPNATGTSPATKTNGTSFTFIPATADWGVVTSFGIYDAATVGNLLYWADLSSSATILDGDTATFINGSLVITED